MTTRIEPTSIDPARFAPTLLRVALGLLFLAHGWTKLTVFTPEGTAAFFQAHGFPGWTAYPVIAAEIGGGLALIAGLRARWVALGLVPIMIGAIKPHLANGFMFTNANGGWELPALVLILVVVQVALGSGAWSLDDVLARTARRPQLRAA